MLGVRHTRGFEIEFTKPLDALRLGTGFVFGRAMAFRFRGRRGRARWIYAGQVRKRLAGPQKGLLEVEGLQPSSVVYIRLLPPCFAEDNAPGAPKPGTRLAGCRRTAPARCYRHRPGAQNILTDAERQAGWKLLFDGKTPPAGTAGKSEFPAGWEVIDGCLVHSGRR